MIIFTPDGPRPIGANLFTPYKTPDSIVRADREWRNAWNYSAAEFNRTLETAQTRYGRMMDLKPLPFIPEDSTKIPGFNPETGKIEG